MFGVVFQVITFQSKEIMVHKPQRHPFGRAFGHGVRYFGQMSC